MENVNKIGLKLNAKGCILVLVTEFCHALALFKIACCDNVVSIKEDVFSIF